MKLIIILGALTSIILGSLNFLTYLQYLRYVRNDGQFNQLSPTLTFYKEYTFESSGFSFEIDDLNFIIKKKWYGELDYPRPYSI